MHLIKWFSLRQFTLHNNDYRKYYAITQHVKQKLDISCTKNLILIINLYSVLINIISKVTFKCHYDNDLELSPDLSIRKYCSISR